PENGSFDSHAARIGATQQVFSQDIYGRGPLRLPMTSTSGRIRHGNSGGPVVDREGRVLATVFASAEDTSASGGFGVPNALVRAALGRAPAATPSAGTG